MCLILFFSYFFHSNSSVSADVLQTLKKQCNPLLQKSFKERNPDVDMDEIQNNPNVPDDVKKAITGALTANDADDADEADDGGEIGDEAGFPPPVDNAETFDDDYIMMSDDDVKKGRRKRLDENDEDWLTGRRKGTRPRKTKRKLKKRSKNQTEHGDSAKQTANDNESKTKKKRLKKVNDIDKPANVTVDSSMLSNSLNYTFNSTLDYTLSGSSTNTSILNGFTNSSLNTTNGLDLMHAIDPKRKENKQKKTPRKRDSNDKPIDGLVKKTTSRRQFTSISAIMACIEAVVQGNDVTISDVPVKMENGVEQNVPFNTSSELRTPMKSEQFDKNEDVTIEPKVKVEPKKKPRRKSKVTKNESLQLDMRPQQPPMQSLLPLEQSVSNCVAVKTGLTAKADSKKSRANGTSKSKPSMRKSQIH